MAQPARSRKRGTSGRGTSPAAPARRKRTAPPPPAARQGPRSVVALPADEVERALLANDQPGLLEDYFGAAGYAELRVLAQEAAARGVRGGERVLILPGIMGSTLGVRTAGGGEDTIWVDPIDIATGRLGELSLAGGAGGIEAFGVILFAYLTLKLRLRIRGRDADFFPYDWRLGLPELGRRLAEATRREGRTVHLVAHSMGGLVARAALAHDHGALGRIVTLGTPHHGSYSPVQAFRGIHSVAQKVEFLDVTHDPAELAAIFGTFPGLIEMMPSPRLREHDLFDPARWPRRGPRPAAEALEAARRAQEALPVPGRDQLVLVVGVGNETVVDLRLAGAGTEAEEFEFVAAADGGDGTVPLDLARLDEFPAYASTTAHGSLPNSRSVARAVDSLLATGRTTELPALAARGAGGLRAPAARRAVGEGAARRQRPYDGEPGRPLSVREQRQLLEEFAAPPEPALAPPAGQAGPTAPGTALGADALAGAAAAAAPAAVRLDRIVGGPGARRRLDIVLAEGSVTEAEADACVTGLFRNVAPGGAARSLDLALGGAVTAMLERRMFGANVGEVSVLPAVRHRLPADAVMFVGLGSIDGFGEEVVEAAATNVMRAALAARLDDFAVVPIGVSQGLGEGRVLARLLRGFLAGLRDAGPGPHRLRGFTLCEVEPDRFARLRDALWRLLAGDELLRDFEVQVSERVLPAAPDPARGGAGAVASPPARPAVYLHLREEAAAPGDRARRATVAALLTPGGKAAILRGRHEHDPREIDDLLAEIEAEGFGPEALPAFGERVARAVLPGNLLAALERLDRSAPLVVVHDAAMSRIPWETLHLGGEAPARRGGLSHRYEADDLSVAKWLEERRRAEALEVLLVVDPTGDLPGARKEGAAIEAELRGIGARVRVLRQREARRTELIECFRSGLYDVVHYAGHAAFDPADPASAGILCAGGEVLTGADLARVRSLPSLVFFNACEAGRVRAARGGGGGGGGGGAPPVGERVRRSVNFAEAFLRGGVANYLGTYWEVGDAAAGQFAGAFYRALLAGAPLGPAVLKGREAIAQTVDWANYILYGDPDFVLKLRAPGGAA